MAADTRSRGLTWLEIKGTHRDGVTKVSRYYTSEIARSGVPGWWFEFREGDFFTHANGHITFSVRPKKNQTAFTTYGFQTVISKTINGNLISDEIDRCTHCTCPARLEESSRTLEAQEKSTFRLSSFERKVYFNLTLGSRQTFVPPLYGRDLAAQPER